MNRKRIFTVDPNYSPLVRMWEMVSYLHSHDQHYGEILCTTPKITPCLNDSHVQY